MHNWNPIVTKIEKICNLELEQKYEQAKARVHADFEDLKFHGTSDHGVEGIIKEGFKMPEPPKPPNKPGMFGQGIYFATDSSKSAQDIYTKGSQKLLLCQVLLGRAKEVRAADHSLCLEVLRRSNHDSVFAPRGSSVKNDEFVIFDPDQALPIYIIHFSIGYGLPALSNIQLTKDDFALIELKPTRSFDINDPKDCLYRVAESHFMRMAVMKTGQVQFKIKSVIYVHNKMLADKFENTKGEFKSAQVPCKEVLAFHGTPVENIKSILKNNLEPALHKRQVHGAGSYFSEFPNISLGYGSGLILFKTLPGKEYCGGEKVWPHHNCKKVNPEHTEGYGDMLIIQNPKQFLPYFVYHLER